LANGVEPNAGHNDLVDWKIGPDHCDARLAGKTKARVEDNLPMTERRYQRAQQNFAILIDSSAIIDDSPII
jgi:hypothetical protein